MTNEKSPERKLIEKLKELKISQTVEYHDVDDIVYLCFEFDRNSYSNILNRCRHIAHEFGFGLQSISILRELGRVEVEFDYGYEGNRQYYIQ